MTDPRASNEGKPSWRIVGVGGSAGSLQVLRELLRRLGREPGLSLVVTIHRPVHDNDGLLEVLREGAPVPVEPLADGELPPAGEVRVIPADAEVRFERGCLRLAPLSRNTGTRTDIDALFRALAGFGERAAGVVLSGSGHDGAAGLRALKEAGGLSLVQAPGTAEYVEMPESAIAGAGPDASLDVAGIVEALQRFGAEAAREATRAEEVEAALPEVCTRLLGHTGHDFRHYRTSTLARRVARRMLVVGETSVSRYLARLEQNDDEVGELMRELLIGVTAFFRDAAAFHSLDEKVLAALVEGRSASDPIRVWVPGCATGEEAYSIAMLLLDRADALEHPPPVQVFGSDIHPRSLAIAREGVYPADAAGLSEAHKQRYFEEQGEALRVKKRLREVCLFSEHNLIRDPPFSRLDLVSCRNVLIYLGLHLQQKLGSVFHYALRPGGFLFLGSSESVGAYEDLFRVVDARHRIAQRRDTVARSPWSREAAEPMPTEGARPSRVAAEPDLYAIAQRIALDELAPRFAVVDDKLRVRCVSPGIGRFLEIRGGPLSNHLLEMSPEGMRAGLRAAFQEAARERRAARRHDLPRRLDADERVGVLVQPMPELGRETGLFFVAFFDEPARVPGHVVEDPQLVASLERELATTRADLERAIQDLEAANEELKSGNEELLSMNEELRSANEELETSKEEVQARNDALAKAQRDLENLLASTNVATLFLDDEGNVVSFTPACRELYPLRPSDVGRPLVEVAPNSDAVVPLPSPEEVEAAAPEPIVDELSTRSGRFFSRRVTAYRDESGQRRGLVVTFVDVTELKRTQQAQARARAKVEHLYAAAPIGLGLIDGELRYRRVNDALARLNGRPPEAHIGRSVREVLPSGMADQVEALLRRVLEQGEFIDSIELTGETDAESGVQRTWRGSFHPVPWEEGRAVQAVVLDVTAEREAERQRAEMAQLQRLALDIAGVATWSYEPRTGHVRWDARCRAIWGVEGGEHSSIDVVLHGIHEQDRARVERAVAAAIEPSGAGQFDVDYRVVRPDGEVRFVRARGLPSFDGDGDARTATRLFGTLIDVTEHKQVEQAMQAAKEAAEAASEAKSTFLANMSHELRTPMTAILGFARLLGTRVQDEQARRFVETIQRNGDQLIDILNDILDLSRIESGRLEPHLERFSLVTLVEDVRALMEVRAQEKSLSLEVGYTGLLPSYIESDRTRLRQVLVNLVGNGIKFTERGGVRIDVALVTEAKRPFVELRVSDTGIGMPPAEVERLFQPFEQADTSVQRRYGGTGLGLTITRRFVALLGGEISVTTAPGKGSTFSVWVPAGDLAEAALEEPARLLDRARHPAEVGPLPALEGLRVLVVDDQPEVRDLLAHNLVASGARVSMAQDGIEALHQAQGAGTDGASIDLVLLDMQMPRLDGFETAQRLRAQGFAGRIVAVTAAAMPGDRERALRAGCDAHVHKPIDVPRLFATIASLTGAGAVSSADGASPSADGAGSSADGEVEAHDGQGAAAPDDGARAPKQAASGGAPASLRVLVVEDHDDARDSLLDLLGLLGFDVDGVGSGAEALERVSARAPDVVLCDLTLPDIDGLELVKRLAGSTGLGQTRFLALSGRTGSQEESRALAAGFHRFLTKPIEFAQLEAVLLEEARRRHATVSSDGA